MGLGRPARQGNEPMTVTDQPRLTTSTFMGHGVFESRHLGKAAHRSSLPPETFEALLKWLVIGWLDAGYPPKAVAAAVQAALAAYRQGAWSEGRSKTDPAAWSTPGAFNRQQPPMRAKPSLIRP